eukprot:scaffold3787_cov276-Chaetoceros_neogracile.AAC.4
MNYNRNVPKFTNMTIAKLGIFAGIINNRLRHHDHWTRPGVRNRWNRIRARRVGDITHWHRASFVPKHAQQCGDWESSKLGGIGNVPSVGTRMMGTVDSP